MKLLINFCLVLSFYSCAPSGGSDSAKQSAPSNQDQSPVAPSQPTNAAYKVDVITQVSGGLYLGYFGTDQTGTSTDFYFQTNQYANNAKNYTKSWMYGFVITVGADSQFNGQLATVKCYKNNVLFNEFTHVFGQVKPDSYTSHQNQAICRF